MERTGPSKGWYAVAGAVVVIATAAAVAIFVAGIVRTVTGYHSIPRGEQVVIDLDAGDYTLYWEQRVGRERGVPHGYQILDPTGRPVGTSPYQSGEVMSRGDFDAIAVATFTAPIGGPYTFFSPSADLGVSKGMFEEIGKGFVLSFAVGSAGLLVGLGIFLFVFLRRRSARLAMEPAAQHYGGPPAGSWPSAAPHQPAGGFTPEWGSEPSSTEPAPTAGTTQPDQQAAYAPGQALPPPGWYADPEADGLRYWDGARWTEHRAVRGG